MSFKMRTYTSYNFQMKSDWKESFLLYCFQRPLEWPKKKKIPLPCSIKSPLISLEFKTHPKGWGYTGRRRSTTPQPGFPGPSGMMLVSSCWWWQGDKMGFSKSLKPFLPMSPSCVLRPYLAIGKNLCYRFFHFWLRKFLQVLVSFLM